MKAFWDARIFFIVIGIWADQNLLVYYNGDLSGRVEEIDIRWTIQELEQVLRLGENALHIELGRNIREEMLNDANQNVGLLQRIAEKYCYEAQLIIRT